jgi:hypothetical protein
VVLILQLGLGALAAAANGLGVVAVKGARGLGVVERGPVLVVAGNEQGDAKGTAHDALLAVSALAKAQGQVADGLGARLDAQGLVVIEGVALALDARVLDHAARIGLQPAHGAPNVPVDLDNLLDRRRLEQGRRDALLDAQDDALGRGHADGRAAELDSLERVFDLEEAAFGGEGAACVGQEQSVSFGPASKTRLGFAAGAAVYRCIASGKGRGKLT